MLDVGVQFGRSFGNGQQTTTNSKYDRDLNLPLETARKR
jgi:hypothetical protein